MQQEFLVAPGAGLSLPVRPGQIMCISPFFGLRETMYLLTTGLEVRR